MLFAAPPAGAAVTRPPELSNPEAVVIPADLACGYDLRLSGANGKITQIKFKNGNFFNVGKGVILTYTNLSNGKTYTVNTAGSVSKYTQNPDGKTWTFSATGHNGFVYFPLDSPEGGGAYQYTGRLVLTIDSPKTLNVLSVDASAGKVVDVCARLR
ncbi:hypothetical protein [Arthrobacter sp. UYCu712]|uniref:hypothetical protein n=1 Tax=Arthrobacter sp. UYCu712 TaxID=3156340 RepID=UPI003394D182